eukprot:297415-Alexandrium_andersonii.AAC.1
MARVAAAYDTRGKRGGVCTDWQAPVYVRFEGGGQFDVPLTVAAGWQGARALQTGSRPSDV